MQLKLRSDVASICIRLLVLNAGHLHKVHIPSVLLLTVIRLQNNSGSNGLLDSPSGEYKCMGLPYAALCMHLKHPWSKCGQLQKISAVRLFLCTDVYIWWLVLIESIHFYFMSLRVFTKSCLQSPLNSQCIYLNELCEFCVVEAFEWFDQTLLDMQAWWTGLPSVLMLSIWMFFVDL